MRRSPVSLLLITCLLLPLASCANSPIGQSLQKTLEADPNLKASPSATPTPAEPVAADQPETVQLPADFPAAIPRYPNSELESVEQGNTPTASATPATAGSEVTTRWVSQDSRDRVLSFYQEQLQSNGWKLEPSATNLAQGTITARQADVNVTIVVPPTDFPGTPPAASASPNPAATPTEYEIRYGREAGRSGAAASPSPSASPANGNLAQLPSFSDSTSIGASGGSGAAQPEPQPQLATGPTTFTDLDKTPKELRQYVEDMAKLGVLTPAANAKGTPKSSNRFDPNKAITRREFARWLVATYNRLKVDRPADQIRLGVSSSQAAFRDVSGKDSDFAVIQGLAEAGIVPSSLSGDSTTVTFRPDAPLTRETLLRWKVPLDSRQPLPTATLQAVQQTWGFQDAARIDASALKAVLMDFQNGDQSNIRRAFGYTTLLQPKKAVTRAEAAAALWYFGFQGEGESAREAVK